MKRRSMLPKSVTVRIHLPKHRSGKNEGGTGIHVTIGIDCEFRR